MGRGTAVRNAATGTSVTQPGRRSTTEDTDMNGMHTDRANPFKRVLPLRCPPFSVAAKPPVSSVVLLLPG
jgi:hypothetical protein